MSSEIQRRNQVDLDKIKIQKREWYYRNRKSVLKQQKDKWEEARISKRIESKEQRSEDSEVLEMDWRKSRTKTATFQKYVQNNFAKT